MNNNTQQGNQKASPKQLFWIRLGVLFIVIAISVYILLLPEDQLKKIGRQLTEFVEKNFDDVGTDFAKEALEMVENNYTDEEMVGQADDMASKARTKAPAVTFDAASAVITEGGKRYRLPASAGYDKPWATGWNSALTPTRAGG